MADFLLFIVVIVALTTAWIEWLPREYDIVIGVAFSVMIIGIGIGWMPKWYGWVVAGVGIADLVWQYSKGIRKLGWPEFPDLWRRAVQVTRASLGFIAGLFKTREKPSGRTPSPGETAMEAARRPRIPVRVWIGGVALTALSPITAIPAAVVLATILTIVNLLLLDAESLVLGFGQILKSVLGNTFLIQVATLDFVIRGFLLTGPVLLAAGVSGAKWADRSGRYWQRLLGAGVVIGALYPAMFIIASTLGWFDEPLFN